MEFCLHKWFFDYDIVIGWRTLVFHKCAKCGKVKMKFIVPYWLIKNCGRLIK